MSIRTDFDLSDERDVFNFDSGFAVEIDAGLAVTVDDRPVFQSNLTGN